MKIFKEFKRKKMTMYYCYIVYIYKFKKIAV